MIHAALNRQLGLPSLSGVLKPDLRTDVWYRDPRSIAEPEVIL
jgi:hypothetical protein